MGGGIAVGSTASAGERATAASGQYTSAWSAVKVRKRSSVVISRVRNDNAQDYVATYVRKYTAKFPLTRSFLSSSCSQAGTHVLHQESNQCEKLL